jgi:hypothetical protein
MGESAKAGDISRQRPQNIFHLEDPGVLFCNPSVSPLLPDDTDFLKEIGVCGLRGL